MNNLDSQKYIYDYARPAITADCVIFALDRSSVNVLLVRRKNEPFAGCWAFPGGFVEEDESVEQCAVRELQEETSLTQVPLRQFHTFSAVGRDPRGWTVSTAFLGCICRNKMTEIMEGDDAAEARWFPIDALPPLAFDHQEIFRVALEVVRVDMDKTDTIFDFLNQIFTFDDVDVLFTALLGRDYDPFVWFENMQLLELVEVHNEDIPSYKFNRKLFAEFEELPVLHML